MALEIVTPPVGGQFGPGFRIALETTAIGPLPTETDWSVWIHPVGSETDLRYVDGLRQNTHTVNWDWLAQTDSPGPLQNVSVPLLHGTTVRLLAERREGGVLVESLSQDVVWNMVDGVPLWQEKREASGVLGGGLTAEQADQLAIAAAAVVRVLTQGGLQTSIDVNALVAHPPLGALVVQNIVFLIDGEGEFDLPALSGVFAYGAWWEFTVVPPGVGRIDGPTVRYLTRAMQLRTIHTIAGTDFVTEVLDVDYQRVVWLWREALPKALQYSVTPGFEVAMHFIVSPI